MNFTEHAVYLIRNRRTQEATYFEVREVLPYAGQTILYGETRGHQIRIYAGVREWEGKPTCLPIIREPDARAWDMTTLATGGDEGTRLTDRFWMSRARSESTGPIKVIQEEEFPVLATGRQLYDFWGGTPWTDSTKSRANRDGLVKATRRVIELYTYCKAHNAFPFPAWFLEDRRRCLEAQNHHGLINPETRRRLY
ncbi:MAG: hypothetical protein Q8R28_11220 [Dehalococcoidia bacterium]|nr:hypothetical protein [Dehalococcoidia bacterium]